MSSVLDLLLYLLPLLLVLLPLLARRYPGEQTLFCRAERSPRAWPGVPGTCCWPSPGRALVPRGGELLAVALAGRAPPWAPAVTGRPL